MSNEDYHTNTHAMSSGSNGHSSSGRRSIVVHNNGDLIVANTVNTMRSMYDKIYGFQDTDKRRLFWSSIDSIKHDTTKDAATKVEEISNCAAEAFRAANETPEARSSRGGGTTVHGDGARTINGGQIQSREGDVGWE